MISELPNISRLGLRFVWQFREIVLSPRVLPENCAYFRIAESQVLQIKILIAQFLQPELLIADNAN